MNPLRLSEMLRRLPAKILIIEALIIIGFVGCFALAIFGLVKLIGWMS